MTVENIYGAKTNLSKLIEKVLQGEEVVISKAGKPVARLVPFEEERRAVTYGTLKGKISVPDDFDDYSAEVADMFSEYEPGER
jgi:prevent-host-death family protein